MNCRYQPVQDVADACRTGPATDIIFGLALGYKSCIIPTIVIALTIFVGNSLAGMYGIATAALGMLSTLATGMRHGLREGEEGEGVCCAWRRGLQVHCTPRFLTGQHGAYVC